MMLKQIAAPCTAILAMLALPFAVAQAEHKIRSGDITTVAELEKYLLTHECSGYWRGPPRTGTTVLRFVRIGPYAVVHVKNDQYEFRPRSLQLDVSGSERSVLFKSAGPYRMTLSDAGELRGYQQHISGTNVLHSLTCRPSSRTPATFVPMTFSSKEEVARYLVNHSPFAWSWRWNDRSGSANVTFHQNADGLILSAEGHADTRRITIEGSSGRLRWQNGSGGTVELQVSTNGDLIGVSAYNADHTVSALTIKASPSTQTRER